MESQTDGVEWVLGVLFGIGLLAVVAAAILELAGLRRPTSDDEPDRTSASKGAGSSDEETPS